MTLIDRDDLISRFEKAIKVRPEIESGLNVAISFTLSAPAIDQKPAKPEHEHSEEAEKRKMMQDNWKAQMNMLGYDESGNPLP